MGSRVEVMQLPGVRQYNYIKISLYQHKRYLFALAREAFMGDAPHLSRTICCQIRHVPSMNAERRQRASMKNRERGRQPTMSGTAMSPVRRIPVETSTTLSSKNTNGN